VITGKIADWQITSSSVYPVEWDKDCAERYGRVYQPDRLGWCAKYKSNSEWIQVDLGVASKVFIYYVKSYTRYKNKIQYEYRVLRELQKIQNTIQR